MNHKSSALDVNRREDEDVVDYIARMCNAIFAPTTEQRAKAAKRKQSYEQWVDHQAKVRKQKIAV